MSNRKSNGSWLAAMFLACWMWLKPLLGSTVLTFLRDMKRVLPFLALTLLLTFGDAEDARLYLYVMGGLTGVAALTHVIRRVLFPYIDMREMALKASKSATGASVVFLSVSLIIVSFVLAFAILMS